MPSSTSWCCRAKHAAVDMISKRMQGIKFTPTYAFFKRGLKVRIAAAQMPLAVVNAGTIPLLTCCGCRWISLWPMKPNSWMTTFGYTLKRSFDQDQANNC